MNIKKNGIYVLKYCWNLLLVSLVILATIIVVNLPHQYYNSAKKYTPVRGQIHFSGTMYESSQVQPGTFTIIKPWSEAEKWGKDAILSYKVLDNGVKCTAWTPNPNTPGTFFKSEWELNANWLPGIETQATFNPATGEAVIRPIKVFTAGVAILCVCAVVAFAMLMFTLDNVSWRPFKIVFKPKLLSQ